MKLILKTLKQVELEIEVESDLITVKELKLKIESLYSYDSDIIKLIYKGAILDDAKPLNHYQINENCSIIIMNTKNKQAANKTETNNNINNNLNYPIKQNIPKFENQEKKEEITDILKDNLNITINSLVDMGFEKSQVEIAVKAANGRIDLAIEYLNNGIPEKSNNNNLRNNNNNNEIMRELRKQASIIKVLCKDNKRYIFYLLDNIKRNDPGLLRLITDYRNEFKKLLDEPVTEEDEKIYKNIETKADEIISKRMEKAGEKVKEFIENMNKEKEEKEKKEKEEKEKEDKNEENKEGNNEEIKEKEKTDINENEKKEEKKENVEMKVEKEEIKEEKKPEENKENQQLNNDISQEKKEEEKMEIEKETEEKKDKPENNVENINQNENKNTNENTNNQIENQLTDKDKEIIKSLQDLGGFPYDKVVEAYIVCNKNEELTANYLFELNN